MRRWKGEGRRMIMRLGVGLLVRGGLRVLILIPSPILILRGILILILVDMSTGLIKGMSMMIMGMGLILSMVLVMVMTMTMNKNINKTMMRIYSQTSTDKALETTVSLESPRPRTTSLHLQIMVGNNRAAIRRTRGERTRSSRTKMIDWDDTRARKVFRRISCCDLRRSVTMGIVL